ncbi:VENN motif pre-toxin domain-containing protein [Proteus terrae]|uniref:CdiA C-terminal domain-containing protein n=2 Tax=Proteus terrae TaxID=1574161 RepID=UPI00301E2F87
MGNNIVTAIANGSAPYLANEVKNQIQGNSVESDIQRTIAHGLLNASLALAKGENAVVQASGAMTGETVGILSHSLYGKTPEELTETEKQNISAWATLTSGIVGGLISDNSAGVANAAQAGKVVVENNLMGGTEDGQVKFAQAHVSDVMSCSSSPSGDACIRGQAVDNALKLALVSGLGSSALIVVADTAAAGCLANPVLCANEVGTFIIETLGAEAAPAGIAITGTAGYTAKLTKEQLVELATLQAVAKKEGVEVAPEIVNKVISGKVNQEISIGSLTGSQTKLPPNATSENIRSLVRENESARILSENGFHVEQNPVTSGIKNPDYKINGEIFDNYAPSSGNIRNIWREVEKKVEKGQTNSVVINLADTKVSVSDLQKQFSDWPVKGLDKIIVIDQSGKPVRIK